MPEEIKGKDGSWKAYDTSSDDFNMADAMQEMITEAQIVDGKEDVGKAFDQRLAMISYDKPADTDKTNKELSEQLKKSFAALVEKNKIKDLEYKDFKEILDGLADYSKREAEFNRLYLSKLVSAVTDASIIRAVTALGYLIDTAIAKIMDIAKNQTGDSYMAVVGTIRETFTWIEKIEELKRRYYISGVDSSMKQLSAQNDNTQEQKLSIADIRDLITKANEKPAEQKPEAEQNKEIK
jgi:replicative DNA helicase